LYRAKLEGLQVDLLSCLFLRMVLYVCTLMHLDRT